MTNPNRSRKFFYSRRPDGKFDICGHASLRPGNAPGSGSVFAVGWADTEAAAKYDVDCRMGRDVYSLAKFAALNSGAQA